MPLLVATELVKSFQVTILYSRQHTKSTKYKIPGSETRNWIHQLVNHSPPDSVCYMEKQERWAEWTNTGCGELNAKTIYCVKNFSNNQEEISSPTTLVWALASIRLLQRAGPWIIHPIPRWVIIFFKKWISTEHIESITGKGRGVTGKQMLSREPSLERGFHGADKDWGQTSPMINLMKSFLL